MNKGTDIMESYSTEETTTEPPGVGSPMLYPSKIELPENETFQLICDTNSTGEYPPFIYRFTNIGANRTISALYYTQYFTMTENTQGNYTCQCLYGEISTVTLVCQMFLKLFLWKVHPQVIILFLAKRFYSYLYQKYFKTFILEEF